MKRYAFALSFVTLLTTLSVPVVGHAYIHEIRPVPVDLSDLDHWCAYTWGINLELQKHEKIVSASLFFDDIRNWNNDTNDLWIQLLESALPGVRVLRDYEAQENYFAGYAGTEIEHYRNLTTTPRDLEYLFDTEELSLFSLYVADGNFGLGFDPDCHYWNNGVTLRVETVFNPVPAAALLFPSGLIVLAVVNKYRKRKNL